MSGATRCHRLVYSLALLLAAGGCATVKVYGPNSDTDCRTAPRAGIAAAPLATAGQHGELGGRAGSLADRHTLRPPSVLHIPPPIMVPRTPLFAVPTQPVFGPSGIEDHSAGDPLRYPPLPAPEVQATPGIEIKHSRPPQTVSTKSRRKAKDEGLEPRPGIPAILPADGMAATNSELEPRVIAPLPPHTDDAVRTVAHTSDLAEALAAEVAQQPAKVAEPRAADGWKAARRPLSQPAK